jgi:hypothetical protein
MSSNLRQSELFAGQDWTAIYKSFNEVNLNAFDFDTIRSSMKDYIQRNYPEDFNDWIESSEFVALLDLMAYLGQSLAFRMDINARENFMDVARARESILRLSRYLSYSPRRNYPARGLVKLTEIRVSQDIIDSSGTNLNNVVILWDDPNNPSWYEQFVLVMNACLIQTNPFGTPLKSASISGTNTQLYRMENIPFTAGNIPFSASVGGINYNFDLVNPDFSTSEGFFERSPDLQSSFHIIYRNDGNGYNSKDTGFFLYFKQGSLQRRDISINVPIENQLIDIDINSINDIDVWLQTVDNDGIIEKEWTRVGFVPSDDLTKIVMSGENVSYNSLAPNVRDIYQTITRDNDQVTLRFGDGRFGTIPMGNVRFWYRQSAGTTLNIRPEDMRNLAVPIPYQASNGTEQVAVLSFSLQESVINSAPAETDDEIRRRSSAMYATQGRMASGEDYNNFPASNNLALKVKSINRVYSGHSRFIDLNDPTGTYQSTNVFSDDGCLYREDNYTYDEIPLVSNFSTQDMITNRILPSIQSVELRDFLYQEWLEKTGDGSYNFTFSGTPVIWQQSSNSIYSSTGRFARTASIPATDDEWNAAAMVLGIHAPDTSVEKFISQGALIKFKKAGWVTVNNVDGTGATFLQSNEGPVRLNEVVETGDTVLRLLPTIRRELSETEFSQIETLIAAKRSFGIGWDFVQRKWFFIDAAKLNLSGSYDYETKDSTSDTSWLIKCEYSPLNWRITARGLRYVFESTQNVKFFFVSKYRSIDPNTGKVGTDHVNILSSNTSPSVINALPWVAQKRYFVGEIVEITDTYNGAEISTFYECVLDHTSGVKFEATRADLDLTSDTPKAILVEYWRPASPGMLKDIIWDIQDTYNYDDGYMEPRRIKVTFSDADVDGQPDDPESFNDVTGEGVWVFHQRVTDTYGYSSYKIIDGIKAFAYGDTLPVLQPNEVIYVYETDTRNGTFYRCLLGVAGVPVLGRTKEIAPLDDQTEYTANKGRTNLKFQWRHYAPVDHRIDPAISNIIDIFVLTREYDTLMKTWYKNGANVNLIPAPTSELQLRNSYADLEEYKMFSDQISWRPVKYKLMFGKSAASELQVKFKVVKLPNTNISDGEIKSRVITAIQNFFDVNSWDFGETFYFTELAGYIHKELVSSIASVVPVPLKESQSFGELFEVRCNPDELFFPTANVSDVEIIPANTATSLRIR